MHILFNLVDFPGDPYMRMDADGFDDGFDSAGARDAARDQRFRARVPRASAARVERHCGGDGRAPILRTRAFRGTAAKSQPSSSSACYTSKVTDRVSGTQGGARVSPVGRSPEERSWN